MTERRYLSHVLLTMLFTVVCVRGLAQIPDVEVQIVNPLKVSLPLMERDFDKIMVKPPEPVYPPLVYDVAPFLFTAPPYKPSLRPLKIRMPEIPTPRRGYVSLGFGNYTSPFAEAFFPVVSRKQSSANIRLHHHSFLTGPVDGRNSASGRTSVSLDYRSQGKTVLSEGLISYRNNYSGFYGYAPGTETTRREIAHGYNQVSAGWTVRPMSRKDASWRMMPAFSYLWDNLEASEVDVSLGVVSGLQVGRQGKAELDGQYDVLALEDEAVQAKPRHLAQFGGSYLFSPVTNIDLKAGLRVTYENDSLVKGDVHVYPMVEGKWRPSDKWVASLTFTGGVDKVSLHRLSAENLWLDRNLSVGHANRLFDVGADVQASLGGGASARAGVQYTSFANQYFLVNSSFLGGDRARFEAIYDDAQRLDLFGVFDLQKGSASVRWRGDWFGWNLSELAFAYHRPTWQSDLSAQFKIAQRLLVRPGWMLRGGIRALEDDGITTITLKAANDLSLQMDYTFSERGSVLIRGNNLLGQSYELYRHYPVRGVQVIAGLTWKF